MNDPKIKQFINGPSLVTLVAFAFAWTAIVLLLKDHFYVSFAFVIFAFIADTFDGYLARRLNQTSDFGGQLDGHVDVFIYLLYPALAFYFFFGLNDYLSLVIIFLFLASGLIRLVRFNVVGYVPGQSSDKNYPGLPVFMSHLLVLVFIILKLINFIDYFYIISNFLILLMAYLMLTSFPFPKPKNIKPVIVFLLALAIISLFFSQYGINK
jgi:CDP-diacylglycerol---serine O-phosphatidyltransferase